MSTAAKTYEELLAENEALQWQLEEATETLHAIRTGQVDALVVQGSDGHELYSLHTADHAYRVFIEKMNEGALSLNSDGVILYSNSRFAEMTGYALSEVTGKAFSSFVAEACQQDFKAAFGKSWSKDTKQELYLQGKNHQHPCQLSFSRLELDGMPSMSVILTDLSYQKEVQQLLKANNDQLAQANEALAKSNHDLQQFASVASHDLQEPLRKMLLFSNMLKSKLGPDIAPEATAYLNKVLASSERMKRFISDILSYAHLDAAGIVRTDTDLNEVVFEIVDDFEVLIADKGATIDIGKLPVIQASRGQMRQLFQNLISNALKFSVPGRAPHITIRSRQDEAEHYLITVADNGIGFDEQFSDSIFKLFQRLNTKDQYEGSGIGLSVARKIAESHRGAIGVKSVVGEGTTFSITLPAEIG